MESQAIFQAETQAKIELDAWAVLSPTSLFVPSCGRRRHLAGGAVVLAEMQISMA